MNIMLRVLERLASDQVDFVIVGGRLLLHTARPLDLATAIQLRAMRERPGR